MKIRGIIFTLEWILANTLVLKVLSDEYSFYVIPWILWNITFGIFLFKLFTAPEDDNTNGGSVVWPIGPAVGAFGFVLTAIKVSDGSKNNWNIIFGCVVCLFGFVLIGISSDALGDEWRDAPPPEVNNKNDNNQTIGQIVNDKSVLLDSNKHINLVTTGPYGIIRHPIYCGLLLEAFGSNIVGGFRSVLAVIAFFSVSVAYIVQLSQEEHELNKLLGEKYDQYKQGTKYKLIPFLF